jgi:hypothetical protein
MDHGCKKTYFSVFFSFRNEAQYSAQIFLVGYEPLPFLCFSQLMCNTSGTLQVVDFGLTKLLEIRTTS